MPSGCSECPKCHQQTLQPYPSRGRAYCLRVADCGYAEDLAPDKDAQIAVLVEALKRFSLWLEQECTRGTLDLGFGPDWSAKKVELALDRLLADLPAAARERTEERERLWEVWARVKGTKAYIAHPNCSSGCNAKNCAIFAMDAALAGEKAD